MDLNRRKFINLAMAGAAATALTPATFAQATAEPKIKALVFDAFPIFDPRPIFDLADDLFPGRGAELSNIWRARQFEYTWLRSLGGKYVDFWQVTEDSLQFAAKLLKINLSSLKRSQLVQAYLALKPWPEVPDALTALKKAGFKLAFLSNFTPQMLDSAIHSSGLDGVFDEVISTDRAKTYKPATQAYQLALDVLKLSREEILFVPYAGWDAAGAKWFGYKTFWVNPMGLPGEELGVTPDASGSTLKDLVNYLTPTNPAA
jgi:2-haloacid dehalogenase